MVPTALVPPNEPRCLRFVTVSTALAQTFEAQELLSAPRDRGP